MNSSWNIPFSHSVSVEEIRMFQACAGLKRVDMWYVLRTTQNGECACFFCPEADAC